ncbi:GNAT family N-acetyltransferase [Cryomorpha ignava]|uniref:GNAT family N-acetyltransferase n=1 Tax=Cryomorpha ignava TaxID=101383 RepID=A0A7K3WQF9_9FLAO|nr:GNAT family N-acetyltransferase [Cryomorpha ignava]NEN23899.1 GNAT family N-acetyltransferase [Cryomorpha ignava]
MKPSNNIETERLILKPTSNDDAEFIYDLLNSPKWLKFIGDRNIKNLEDAVAYIEERIRPQQIRLGYSNYTVIRKKDGAKIGSCGLYDRPGIEGIDLGFAFLPDFEKQGYGFEGANMLLDAAINQFELEQVSAITLKENKASQKLLEKLGLKHIRNIVLPRDPDELMLYQLNVDAEGIKNNAHGNQ